MKMLRLYFTDFWHGFDPYKNYWLTMLMKEFDLVVDNKNPEIVIYSNHGSDFLKYPDAIRILYCGENISPNFRECHYSFSFEYDSYSSRNLRLPLYVFYGMSPEMVDKNPARILDSKSKFCNMIVSNPNSKYRIDFFKILNSIKGVDSGGRVLNNVGYYVTDKISFLKDYRFTIAFENSSSLGYTTEKILEPMRSNSIPIYWGNKNIYRDFNTKSFINIHDFSTLSEAAHYIVELDQDQNRMLEILGQPYLIENPIENYFDEFRVINFVKSIIYDPNNKKLTSHKTNGFRNAQFNVLRKKTISMITGKSYCHIH